MSNYQSLYRTWRPRRFSDMVGQEATRRMLRNQAKTGHVAHAYLFCGSHGTGKTSAARIMALAINCENPQEGDPCLECGSCKNLSHETSLDLLEMDAASNSSVDNVRVMLSKTDYPPQFVKYKVYIIDEVHMLSGAAFNALLKTLEEPPEYMVFILATTEPQKLPATILSRCQRFDFGRIADAQIVERLKQAIPEGTKTDEEALQLIASAAEGSMRDAWSLMDMVLASGLALSQENVREALGSVSREMLFSFLDALAHCDSADALSQINILMRQGRDVQVFLRDFSAHLRQVLGVKLTGQPIHPVGDAVSEQLRQQASGVSELNLLRMLEKCMQAENDARWAAAPRAVLDVFALRVCQVDQEQDLSGILARLSQLETAMAGLDTMPAKAPVQETEPETEPAAVPEPAAQPEASLPLIQSPRPAAPGVQPKAAWNRMLERLGRENPGLFSLMHRGRYGGFQEDLFSLILPPEEDILTNMLNEDSRAQVISQLLSEEMGIPVSFRAARQANTQDLDQEALARENLKLLSKVFGRDKIIVKSDPK
ncbi:MAG: DNA polymerase III subunit gamma/tau [Eubacteriales bacterium]|nr:DNA polymerase III subunit gamma/tau [Eubacteriales bacterium]